VDGPRCTTKLETAHGTEFREVLYHRPRLFAAHHVPLATRMWERPVSASTTRRRTKALTDRRSEPRQFDLFGGNRPRSIGDAPTWSAPPVEARSELIGLMRRLILELVDREQRSTAAGDSRDL
jgi:hypothetical protein